MNRELEIYYGDKKVGVFGISCPFALRAEETASPGASRRWRGCDIEFCFISAYLAYL